MCLFPCFQANLDQYQKDFEHKNVILFTCRDLLSLVSRWRSCFHSGLNKPQQYASNYRHLLVCWFYLSHSQILQSWKKTCFLGVVQWTDEIIPKTFQDGAHASHHHHQPLQIIENITLLNHLPNIRCYHLTQSLGPDILIITFNSSSVLFFFCILYDQPISCFVKKIVTKCPLQVPRTESDVFKLLVLSDQQFKIQTNFIYNDINLRKPNSCIFRCRQKKKKLVFPW